MNQSLQIEKKSLQRKTDLSLQIEKENLQRKMDQSHQTKENFMMTINMKQKIMCRKKKNPNPKKEKNKRKIKQKMIHLNLLQSQRLPKTKLQRKKKLN